MKNVDIISKIVSRSKVGGVISPSSIGAGVNVTGFLKESIWNSVFELKNDDNGVPYLFSKMPFVTQYGITMYSGVGTTIPSIYDGLPIDGTTIYWENGILKAQGGGNDGIDEAQLAEYLTTNNYAKKSDIPSLSGYATQTWVASQGYITGITSTMVTSALGFTPYNANNFTKANIKSTLGISDWALAKSKPSYTYTEIGGTPDLSVYALKTSLSSYQPLISTTNKLAYSLVSGTPTSLKNPTSLTFGSKTYDGSEAKTITASDLGALTSHQTIYALTLQAGTFSAGTYTPNSTAKTINIPTTTAHISESGNLYFTNARAVSALSSTLASYVTLGGSQTITGAKNFTGGLSVNGGSLIYNASEGYWKLEGNLLVTGGIAMYSNGSDIGGGGTGGGSIDYPLSWSGFSSGSYDGSAAKTIYIPSKLSELTNDSGYALSSALSGYLPLSGGELSNALSIKKTSSDSLPLLTIEKGGAYDSRITLKNTVDTFSIVAHSTGAAYITLNGAHSLVFETKNTERMRISDTGGVTITSTLNTPLSVKTSHSDACISLTRNSNDTAWLIYNDTGWRVSNSGWMKSYALIHSGNYSSYALPLTGGTISNADYGALNILRKSTQGFSGVGFSNWSGMLGYLGIGGSGSTFPNQPTFVDTSFNSYGLIHSGNIGSQSVNYASSAGNADKVDGYHAESIFTYEGETYVNGESSLWNSLGTKVYAGALPDGLTDAYTYGQTISFGIGNAKFDMYVSHISTSPNYDNSNGGIYVRSGWQSDRVHWRRLAYIDSNVASATKLENNDSYTAWGQTFFANGKPNNIFGTAYFPNGDLIYAKDKSGTSQYVLGFTSSLGLGYGSAGAGYDTYILGNNIHFRYSTSRITGITLNSSGNVGIGTTNPSYKFQVNGDSYLQGITYVNKYITFDKQSSSANTHSGGRIGTFDRDGGIVVQFGANASNRHFAVIDQAWTTELFLVDNSGNVKSYGGISATSGTFSSTLSVTGAAMLNSGLTINGSIIQQHGESRFAYGSYRDPASGISSAIKVSGGISQFEGDVLLCTSGSYNVGIGTLSPSAKLHVNGAISATSGTLSSTLSVTGASTFTGKTTHNGGLESTVSSAYAIYGNSSTSRVSIAGDNGKSLHIASKGNSADYYLVSVNYGQTTLGSGGRNAFTIRGDGNVGIGQNAPSAKLHVAGNILTSGSITMNSMRSMKNIINENGLSLEELSTIKPTRFTWKDGRDNRIHVGGIADDVMKVLPEVVFKGNDGVLSMDYASAAFVMAASLIQPMTEHERRIANLEHENALLKEEIRNLKSA